MDTMDGVIVITAGIVHRKLTEEFAEGEHEPETVAKRAAELVRKDENSWLLGTDDQRFRAMCGAVGLYYHERDPEVFARIDRELSLLQGLSAATSGIPVDFDALIGDPENAPEPIGLMGIYKAGM